MFSGTNCLPLPSLVVSSLLIMAIVHGQGFNKGYAVYVKHRFSLSVFFLLLLYLFLQIKDIQGLHIELGCANLELSGPILWMYILPPMSFYWKRFVVLKFCTRASKEKLRVPYLQLFLLGEYLFRTTFCVFLSWIT